MKTIMKNNYHTFTEFIESINFLITLSLKQIEIFKNMLVIFKRISI